MHQIEISLYITENILKNPATFFPFFKKQALTF